MLGNSEVHSVKAPWTVPKITYLSSAVSRLITGPPETMKHCFHLKRLLQIITLLYRIHRFTDLPLSPRQVASVSPSLFCAQKTFLSYPAGRAFSTLLWRFRRFLSLSAEIYILVSIWVGPKKQFIINLKLGIISEKQDWKRVQSKTTSSKYTIELIQGLAQVWCRFGPHCKYVQWNYSGSALKKL